MVEVGTWFESKLSEAILTNYRAAFVRYCTLMFVSLDHDRLHVHVSLFIIPNLSAITLTAKIIKIWLCGRPIINCSPNSYHSRRNFIHIIKKQDVVEKCCTRGEIRNAFHRKISMGDYTEEIEAPLHTGDHPNNKIHFYTVLLGDHWTAKFDAALTQPS